MGSPDYEKDIYQNTGGLVIGDRAFCLHKKHRFVYDLSYIWKKYTGFSFVFACWVANKIIDRSFLTSFNSGLKYGIDNIDMAVLGLNHYDSSCSNPKDYLKNKISYVLDKNKKEGMNYFLSKINHFLEH